MTQQQHAVVVNILDKEYRVSCPLEEEQGLTQSAQMLDKRMREIRQAGRVIGADRIAVMAALNFVYELVQLRAKADAMSDGGSEQIERIQRRVEEALSEHPTLDGSEERG